MALSGEERFCVRVARAAWISGGSNDISRHFVRLIPDRFVLHPVLNISCASFAFVDTVK